MAERVTTDARDDVPVKFAVLDKKAAATFKTSFDLHVLLVMRQNGLTKSQAVVQAYHEGVETLGKRLG